MDNLMLALTNNSGVWESVLNWFFSFLGNVGWCVVILTILIKLALSPLEYMQKKGMKKMTAALTLMQPEMEKLKAKCGNNQALYNQKVQELYKKNNVNPAAGCGPMFLFLIISSVVFITFFSCLTKVSTEQINTQYNQITNVYTVAYDYYNGETVEVNGVEYKIRDDLKQQLFENNSDYKLYLIEYDNAEAGSEIKSYASRDEYATYKRAQELSQQAVVDGITLDDQKADDKTDNTAGDQHHQLCGGGVYALQQEFQQLQRAGAQHGGDRHEEGEFRTGAAGNTQNDGTQNGRAGTGSAGNQAQTLKCTH